MSSTTSPSTGTMRAVILSGPYSVSVVDKPIPQIQEPGDAIVKVRLSGLCGSDLHTYRSPTSTGFITGHEFVGTIHSLDNNSPTLSSKFKIGDRVVSPFTTSCLQCQFCQDGLTGRCTKGALFGCKALEGGQAEYVRVPMAATTLLHAPSSVPDSHLILMADIFPTGCSVVKKGWEMLNCAEVTPEAKEAEKQTQGQKKTEPTALIIGCGPVGLCAIMAAKERFGEGNVFAMDPVKERRDAAARYGAIPLDPSLSPSHHLTSPSSPLATHTSSLGPNLVLEVVGSSSSLALALDFVRIGGVISSCGVFTSEISLSGPEVYAKGVKLAFGRCHARAMFPESLRLLEKISKRQPELIDEFVQKTVKGLEEAEKWYKEFEERKVGKVVFDLTKEGDKEENK